MVKILDLTNYLLEFWFYKLISIYNLLIIDTFDFNKFSL